ncbi:hypothetical protein AB0D49_25860 [Streptomyces sp. NPDC048290]|uniref:hypothetical protein n=1 Tax=Streptomyces sp. NPDC048290 TaxID=3155811 RepID=UPI003416B6C1
MRSINFQVTYHYPAPRFEGSVTPATVSQEIRTHSKGPGFLNITVDGIPLIELVRRVELPYAQAEQEHLAKESPSEPAPVLAGDYMPLSAGFGWPNRHFLGESKSLPRGGKEGETTLLECTCGMDDCSALMARITVTSQTVTWSAFRNTFRDWDLSALGSFTFSRPQYEESLRTAAARQQSASGHTSS